MYKKTKIIIIIVFAISSIMFATIADSRIFLDKKSLEHYKPNTNITEIEDNTKYENETYITAADEWMESKEPDIIENTDDITDEICDAEPSEQPKCSEKSENSKQSDAVFDLPLMPEDMGQEDPAYYSAEPKYIAVTFDDGPDKEKTPLLLDILKTNNAKATFFVLGNRVEANADIIKRMIDEGHDVGNHTFNHKDLTKLSEESVDYQIDKTNELIKETAFIDTVLVRPAYGARNPAVTELLKAKNMSIIVWNIDPKDWKTKDADDISNHIISRAKDGDIILLHDIYSRSVEAAEKAIQELTKRGFVFLTVTELIERYGGLEAGGIYRDGKGTVAK